MPNLDWISFYSPQPKAIERYGRHDGGNVLGRQDTQDDQIGKDPVAGGGQNA